jgi:hypothetical protein
LVACAVAGGLQGCGGRQQSAQVKEVETPVAAGKREAKEVAPVADAQVYEDEAMLKGSKAIIGGTVENISGVNLEGLSAELELRRRSDDVKETQIVEIKPQNLAPGEKGRYLLTITREWNVARLVRLRSSKRTGDIAYNTTRGALRPPEKTPEAKPKVVVVVPRPRPKGEEFINTPETADRVP